MCVCVCVYYGLVACTHVFADFSDSSLVLRFDFRRVLYYHCFIPSDCYFKVYCMIYWYVNLRCVSSIHVTMRIIMRNAIAMQWDIRVSVDYLCGARIRVTYTCITPTCMHTLLCPLTYNTRLVMIPVREIRVSSMHVSWQCSVTEYRGSVYMWL